MQGADEDGARNIRRYGALGEVGSRIRWSPITGVYASGIASNPRLVKTLALTAEMHGAKGAAFNTGFTRRYALRGCGSPLGVCLLSGLR